MVEHGGVDLIHLADGGSSVRLRVLGRRRPGVTPYKDHLNAEAAVSSGFANGRLEMCLPREDLDDWSSSLDEPVAGRDIRWLSGPKAAEPVQTGEDALHEPALNARTRATCGVPVRDQWLHGEPPDQATVLVVDVTTIS